MGAYQREGFSMGLLYFFSSLLFSSLLTNVCGYFGINDKL